MFSNLKFLSDLVKYCDNRSIDFAKLTYTEQLACIRSMLVGICRNSKNIKKI